MENPDTGVRKQINLDVRDVRLLARVLPDAKIIWIGKVRK